MSKLPPPKPEGDSPSGPPKTSNLPKIIGTSLGILLILFIGFCIVKAISLNLFLGILLLLLVINAMRTNVKVENIVGVGALRYNILSQAMNMLAEAVQLQSKRITELSNKNTFGVKSPIQTH